MDKQEAKEILQAELHRFRAIGYSELAEMVDTEPSRQERTGATGKGYQIEIEVIWDSKPGGNTQGSP